MTSSDYLEKIKEVQGALLDYIEDHENSEENFQKLHSILDNQNIQRDKHELKLFLYLISAISNNHHREIDFFQKIERLLTKLKNDIHNNISNSEIIKIFKKNKKMLLFLIEEKIVFMDDFFMKEALKQNEKDKNYFSYFYQESLLNPPENFEEKRKIGENESYICSLIRQDSVEEFISYATKTNLSLSSSIKPSIFETNPFLIDKEPTLIEYATFFGSIQIFKYFQHNNVELTNSLWLYAIHGKNPDIIHLLEENHINPPNNKYEECFNEAVKCHHNDIANYFKINYLEDQNFKFHDLIKYYNFSIFQYNLIDESFFYYLCKNDCYTFVEILQFEEKIDVNKKIISNKLFLFNSITNILI